MSHLRIGVNLFPGVGGSGHLATRLGEHLAQRGHIIHFITYQRPFALMWEQPVGIYVDLVDRLDYPLFSGIGSPYTIPLTSKILKVAGDAKLDLLHAHYAIPHAMAAYMAREIAGLPYVITLHGSDVHTLGIDPAYKPVVKFTAEKANAVTAVSRFLQKKAYDGLGIQREIHVIPNFVDVEQFHPMLNCRIKLESGCVGTRKEKDTESSDPDEKVLLHISNFREVKRVTDLIDIIRTVVDDLPKTHLVIVGDGPSRIDVERKIERLNLCNNVHLLGVRSNMQEILCGADAFLLNSTLEGMPLVLLESMACEVPVVTTPAGGVPELVRPGVDGIVTKGFEPDEFAQEVIKILENDSLRSKLAKAGRKRVVENFSPDKIVPMYERVFEEAIAS
ncbi:MAG: N-acetyl-alpha-D-glucosaminyl L-malate synthase BshA [Candidatus Thorarchaeota archaeon]|nr:MAG: N-acetyl-alpha-D-glucosaminyl L-malate synthase BshA [Candidatus Thorarchaeota archaeon]